MKGKLILGIGLLSLVTTVSHADDSDLKLATIKEMYSQAKPENNEENGNQYINLFFRYSAPSMKQAINQIKNFNKAVEEGKITTNPDGSEIDEGDGPNCYQVDRRTSIFPYFGNGDFGTGLAKDFSILKNGNIRVRILEDYGNTETADIDYSLTCTNNQCLIDDQYITSFYNDTEAGNKEVVTSMGSLLQEIRKECHF